MSSGLAKRRLIAIFIGGKGSQTETFEIED